MTFFRYCIIVFHSIEILFQEIVKSDKQDNEQYGIPNLYTQRCCLKPGQYTLTCVNRRNPVGWGEGYLDIQGHRYCNDFMSYRIMQKITIKGTYY